MNTVTTFVKSLKTSQIVGLYNLAVPDKPVTKFSDRTTAEKRLTSLIATWDGHGNAKEAFAAFLGKVEAPAKAKGIIDTDTLRTLPATAVVTDAASVKALKALELADSLKKATGAREVTVTDIKVPAKGDAPAPVKGKKDKAPRAEGEPAAKQNTPPHLNLRCPVCQYYAKSTPAMLKLARLVCPVDPKHGKLLTAEERGEKRGR